ncbi:MAG: helix-turn-helix transcriptional regulator [Nitrospirota bacterium]
MVKVRLKPGVIENILARKSLSQNWLAGKLDISSGYISQMLKGKRLPSPKMRDKLLAYFNHLGFDDLFEIQK